MKTFSVSIVERTEERTFRVVERINIRADSQEVAIIKAEKLFGAQVRRRYTAPAGALFVEVNVLHNPRDESAAYLKRCLSRAERRSIKRVLNGGKELRSVKLYASNVKMRGT